MIEMPRHFLTATTPTPSSASNKTVRFQVIPQEEQPPMIAVERRRTPSRRKPNASANKPQIERRVSLDRRRTTFSSKA